MNDSSGHLRICVIGPFQAFDGNGADITPKAAKNQAILALLAMSPGMARPRRWLEDKLWSTFGAEQASANMRQALSKLRVALGPLGDVLSADRTKVSLDPSRVTVDLHETFIPDDGRSELLQGFDVRDPEFEEWLRLERQDLQSRIAQATPSAATGILINSIVQAEEAGATRLAGTVLASRIAESISEHVRAWRQDSEVAGHENVPLADVLVSAQLTRDGSRHAVLVKALHQPSARILYSKLLQLDDFREILETADNIARTVFEASDQIVGKLPQVLDSHRPEARATALSRLGLYKMFSYEHGGLREAFALMRQAQESDENGVYFAWASMIRTIQMMEMAEASYEPLREEAEALMARALEIGSDNPLVHAILSKVRGAALKDVAGCFELARTAYEGNPTSAYACVAMAEAYLMAGRTEEALAMSSRARFIARGSPFRHWWDTGHCVIAVACGRPQEAIEAGESAARAAPLSRPALRHLLALYAMEGQTEKALTVAQKLIKIEPGFSVDRIVNDETYPVRTLRNMGMLEPIRALL